MFDRSKMFTITEAAAKLACCEATVRRAVNAGRVRATRAYGRVWLRASEIQKLQRDAGQGVALNGGGDVSAESAK